MTVRCLGCMTEYEANSQACPNCGYVPGTPAESLLHLQPGAVLAGRYIIGKVIGFGGFGVTYISWDQTLQQPVAIKEYLPSEFATRAGGQTHVTVFSGNKAEQFAGGMVKFIDEARKLAKFQSEEGIVRVYDSFEANNTAYIVMEYLDGETLTAYLEREGKIPINQAIEMLTPVIHSLEAVHQAGVIHRDIAPDNIMITKDGQVKLIDFGAARYATTSHSRSLTVIIKPGYSPEEQYRSRGDQGPHTDVYSLGAVLYRMVTGTTPPDALERRAFFENKKKNILIPPSKNCKLTRNQENAILNAMNIRVEDRTSTAAEFLSQLTAVSRVQRATGKIKAIDLMKWPLWAKITVPACSAAAITLLVLLFTGTIGFENHLATTLTIDQNMTRVPSVVNCTVEVAQDRLGKASLPAVISGRETSDTIPANMVLRQSVSAGEIVEKNTRVELYISAAAEQKVEENTMPNVSYYTRAEAEEMLKKLGAVVTVEQEYSSDVAAGVVLRSNVTAGEPLAEGNIVTIYVSIGPEPVPEETEEPSESPDGSGTATQVPITSTAPSSRPVATPAPASNPTPAIVFDEIYLTGNDAYVGHEVETSLYMSPWPKNINDISVTWYSSDSSNASLYENYGNTIIARYFKPNRAGTVTITAVVKAGGQTYTLTRDITIQETIIKPRSYSYSINNADDRGGRYEVGKLVQIKITPNLMEPLDPRSECCVQLHCIRPNGTTVTYDITASRTLEPYGPSYEQVFKGEVTFDTAGIWSIHAVVSNSGGSYTGTPSQITVY